MMYMMICTGNPSAMGGGAKWIPGSHDSQPCLVGVFHASLEPCLKNEVDGARRMIVEADFWLP